MPLVPETRTGPKDVGGIDGLDVTVTLTSLKLVLQKWFDREGTEEMGEGWPDELTPLLKGIVPAERVDAIGSADGAKAKLKLVLEDVKEFAAILFVRWITDPDTEEQDVEAWRATNPVNLAMFKTITRLFSDDCAVGKLKPRGSTKEALTKTITGACPRVCVCVCVCMCVYVCVCGYVCS